MTRQGEELHYVCPIDSFGSKTALGQKQPSETATLVSRNGYPVELRDTDGYELGFACISRGRSSNA
jgi:hypothetical protein